MSSYIFRGIDAPLWALVKEKAAAEGLPMLTLVENLFEDWRLGKQQWAWDNAAEVYKERDLLVRALSLQFPSHLMYRSGHQPATGPKKLIVCIHGPTGQMTWTIPETMRKAYTHLELTANDWDGHKTADRMTRLGELQQ